MQPCGNTRSPNSPDLLSANCQFCGTALVADPAAAERVAPEAGVPFGVSKQQAGDALKTWTSSRWFAPSSLKKVSSAETFTGSYLPLRTYDSSTVSDYTGERRHPAQGRVSRLFDDALVPGTTKAETDLIGKLEPWALQTATPFRPD